MKLKSLLAFSLILNGALLGTWLYERSQPPHSARDAASIQRPAFAKEAVLHSEDSPLMSPNVSDHPKDSQQAPPLIESSASVSHPGHTSAVVTTVTEFSTAGSTAPSRPNTSNQSNPPATSGSSMSVVAVSQSGGEPWSQTASPSANGNVAAAPVVVLPAPGTASGSTQTPLDSSNASSPLSETINPALPGNRVSTGTATVAVEGVERAQDGTISGLNLAISEGAPKEDNASVGSRDASDLRSRYGISYEEELFRTKWGWAAYDRALGAAKASGQALQP